MNLYKIQEYFIPYRILDIGANIGQFHKEASEFFRNSYVFSIEADESCEESLKQLTNNYYIGLLAKDDSEYDYYTRKDAPGATGNSIYKELTHFYSDDKLNIVKKQGIKLDNLFEDADCLILLDDDCKGIFRWENQKKFKYWMITF
jgi:hypothetical protein